MTPPKPNSGHNCGRIEWAMFISAINMLLAITIVDFVAPRKKLIIELDGSQHLEQQEYDEERSVFLKSKGFAFLRFWNNDVTKQYRFGSGYYLGCFE